MGSTFAITVIAILAGTGALSAALTTFVRRVVVARGWTSRPLRTRWNTTPTPLFGGVAVFVSFAVAAVLLRFWLNAEFLAICIPSVLVFLLGIVDDAIDLRPRTKLIGQFAAAAWVVYGGLIIGLTGNAAFDGLLTLVWLVGITNAFNLIDNMNGLCGGIAIITAVIRGVLFLQSGNLLGTALCVAFAGAVLGFLFFNFPRATIFMGDAGSLFLGFWLGAIALTSIRSFANNYLALLLFPVLAMLVPISDTVLVAFTRSLQGRPVSVGGKDHFSHRLVAYGLSETKAVLVLWAISALSGGIAVLMSLFGVSSWATISVLFVLSAAILGAYLTRFEPHLSGGLRVPHDIQTIFHLVLDCVLATISWYSSCLILFGPATHRLGPILTLGIVLVPAAKVIALAAGRIYRQQICHFGLEDAVRVAGASVLASTICFLLLLIFPETRVRVSVVVVDFLLFSALALSFRSSFRVLDHLAPERPLPRAIVHGSGAHLDAALRLLRSQYRIAGFLQPPGSEIGQCIRSIPVFGSTTDIVHIMATHVIDAVITTSTNEKELRALRKACLSCRVPLYRLRIDLELLSKAEEQVKAKQPKAPGKSAAA